LAAVINPLSILHRYPLCRWKSAEMSRMQVICTRYRYIYAL